MKSRFLLLAMMIMGSFVLKAQTIMNIHQNNGTVLQIPTNTIDSITYTITSPGNLATITTLSIGNISNTSASSGGNITNDGGSPITQRGVVWSTSPNPTTANNQSNDGLGTGNFNSNLTGLIANTIYYVRAFATNNAGTAYGNELSFTTIAGGGNIVSNPGAGVDFDGYSYASIVLGNGQEWMAENLRTMVYANGDSIPNITTPNQWSNLTTGAWAHYNNDNQYENPYGKLYNWYTVSDTRNVCPNGWHVPSDSEWNMLIGYLDSSFNPSIQGTQSSIAGGMMKSIGIQYWITPNTGATNQSGFSAVPGGTRITSGTYGFIGGNGFYWSSTVIGTGLAWYRYLGSSSGGVGRDYDNWEDGYSVRCIRD
jgi:uncharacterized protein (TIGR02145 family)